MEERIYLNNLYDYYKNLLTPKQRTYFEDYYFDNLTMEEIAINNGVSKNAISKSLMEIEKKLMEYEDILHLYHNRLEISNILDEKTFDKISDLV